MPKKLNRETVSEKADRLKTNYRVILTGFNEAVVIGDHDTYHIKKTRKWACTCPWGRYRSNWKDCSHVVAVKRALDDPACQAPVARLADLIVAQAPNLEGVWR